MQAVIINLVNQCAALIASGQANSILDCRPHVDATAEQLAYIRKKLQEPFDRALEKYRAEFAKTGQIVVNLIRQGPSERVAQGIERATALLAEGRTLTEVAKLLGVKLQTLCERRRAYSELWREAHHRAINSTIQFVRQADRKIIRADPNAFVLKAAAAMTECQRNGEQLFPLHGSQFTVKSLFDKKYLPMRLSEADPRTIDTYRNSVNYWVAFTKDPSLKSITVNDLIHFRDCLKKTRSRQTGGLLSATTVRKHCKAIRSIIDLAGPPAHSCRDALGILRRVPFLKLPRPAVQKEPQIVPLEVIGDVYRAADFMTWPECAGATPGHWWKCLLMVAFCTGLRRRTLFRLEWSHVDRRTGCLRVPGDIVKNGKPIIFPLTSVCLSHLRAVKPCHKLIFPFIPASGDMKVFYKWLYRLESKAGISRERRFGLHALRRTFATVLWQASPQAAQLALGHASISTTAKHYVNRTRILSEAIETLPQPGAFFEMEAISRPLSGGTLENGLTASLLRPV
jgi:integrase